MQRIILASSSKQRKILMDALNVPYEIIPADINEKTIRDGNSVVMVEKIARAKAEKVAFENDAIVIAADSFAIYKRKVFEKPKTIEEARQMLRDLSDAKDAVDYTGFCYIDRKNKIDYSKGLVINFSFRKLSDEEINGYVKKFPVLTWAGAFSPAYIYGLTILSEIKGSVTGLTHGLPMELLIPLLEKSGVKIKP